MKPSSERKKGQHDIGKARKLKAYWKELQTHLEEKQPDYLSALAIWYENLKLIQSWQHINSKKFETGMLQKILKPRIGHEN